MSRRNAHIREFLVKPQVARLTRGYQAGESGEPIPPSEPDRDAQLRVPLGENRELFRDTPFPKSDREPWPVTGASSRR